MTVTIRTWQTRVSKDFVKSLTLPAHPSQSSEAVLALQFPSWTVLPDVRPAFLVPYRTNYRSSCASFTSCHQETDQPNSFHVPTTISPLPVARIATTIFYLNDDDGECVSPTQFLYYWQYILENLYWTINFSDSVSRIVFCFFWGGGGSTVGTKHTIAPVTRDQFKQPANNLPRTLMHT